MDKDWSLFNIRNNVHYFGACKLNKIDRLLFNSCEEACQAFKESSGYPVINPDRISSWVPGKIPRIDGDPYLIGSGVVNNTTQQCVKGYINLATGVYHVYEDFCGPIDDIPGN